jgi:hypothetical protein
MSTGSKRPTGRAAPWRGRKRVKDPRNQFIAVRCSDTEYAAITESAKRAGLSVGAYLRAAATGEAGPRAVRRPPVEHETLARVLGQVGKIGSNVNQVAKGFNGSRLLPGFPEILAIRRDIGELRAALLKALGRGD